MLRTLHAPAAVFSALLALLYVTVQAQTVADGAAEIVVWSDSAEVEVTVTPRRAAGVVASLVPPRQPSELDAGGHVLSIDYDVAVRRYRIEEDTFASIEDVRHYVRTWLRVVLEE